MPHHSFASTLIGRTLRGKYRLDAVLGEGGMGSVFAATHRNRRRFAVKVLHPDLSGNETIRSKFTREGYVANSVGHPGAVAVLDDDVAEDGLAFLVMELLSGQSVEALWEEQGRKLQAGVALRIAEGMLDVLEAAHLNAIVHRDIKPANLFLTAQGELKVLDFGIARLRDDTAIARTREGQQLGTLGFMAPEQARGEVERVDAQTDLWAVGATLFVLLTGELPVEGATSEMVFINTATQPVRPLRVALPSVHPAVSYVVDRALAFEKAERWPNAKAMQEAVRYARSELLGAEGGDGAWRTLLSQVDGKAAARPAPQPASFRLGILGALIATGVVLACLAVVLLRRGSADETPSSAASAPVASAPPAPEGPATVAPPSSSPSAPPSSSPSAPSETPAPSALPPPLPTIDAAAAAPPQLSQTDAAAQASTPSAEPVSGPAARQVRRRAAAPTTTSTPECARILAELSLGNPLSEEERELFQRECR